MERPVTELILLICISAADPICEKINFGPERHCEEYGALRQSYMTRELAEREADSPEVTYVCLEKEGVAV